MGKGAKLTGEQIQRARKLLSKLPDKNEPVPVKIAAGFLEHDFKQARKKGYGHKEICEILRQEEIPFPDYLVKKTMALPQQNQALANEDSSGNNPEKNVGNMDTPACAVNEAHLEQQTAPSGEYKGGQRRKKEKAKTINENTEQREIAMSSTAKFEVTPDTPEGEL